MEETREWRLLSVMRREEKRIKYQDEVWSGWVENKEQRHTAREGGNRKSQNVNDKIFRIFFMMMKLKVLP